MHGEARRPYSQKTGVIEQARQTVKMDPNLWLAHVILGRTYERKGQLSEALAEYQKARQIDDTTAEILMDLGRAYGLSGKRTEAEKVLAELLGLKADELSKLLAARVTEPVTERKA